MLEGKPRLLFFASNDIDIDPYTELRYDYGGKNLPWRKVSYHTYYIFVFLVNSAHFSSSRATRNSSAFVLLCRLETPAKTTEKNLKLHPVHYYTYVNHCIPCPIVLFFLVTNSSSISYFLITRPKNCSCVRLVVIHSFVLYLPSTRYRRWLCDLSS